MAIDIVYTITDIFNGIVNIMGAFVQGLFGQAGPLVQIIVLTVLLSVLIVAWKLFGNTLKTMFSGFKGLS